MGWFGGLTTRKSQRQAKEEYDYRVHLEQDQSARGMKLSFGAYSTEAIAAVAAWVILEPNDKEQAGGTVGRGGQNSELGDSEAGGRKPTVSSRGRALAPDVRYVDHAG